MNHPRKSYQEIISTAGHLTLPQVLSMQSQKYGHNLVAIREKAYGIWQTYTWQDYFDYVKKVALGLKAIGLMRGENIGLITNNHPEWLFSEIGGQVAGSMTVNLFTSAIAEELSFSLNRFQAAYVIVQDQEQTDKLLECRDKLDHVRKVIYIDPTGMMRNYQDNDWLISFRDLLTLGEELDRKEPALFAEELKQGRGDDCAVMIQTSGTTGVPKMAMLSHQNFIEMAAQWTEAINIEAAENWISMSPPAWIVDQMWGVGVSLLSGMTMNFAETPETMTEDFREIGPSVIITASRFWEDLASKIRVKMSDAGWIKRKIFAFAENVGRSVVDRQTRDETIPLYLKWAYGLATILIYRPLLDRVGCINFRSAYTGGHPISPDVIRFFRAIGLNLKQCYGLTEAGGIFQVQPDNEVKLETVGKPLPATTIKIAEDQEVLVSSKANFQGYYNDYNATEAVFSNDGWLKTGDAGYIDKDDHLLIIGRKEDIIRNKTGDAFSPDFIETRLKFSPYIKEAVIFGEGRPYISAMVNIDFGNVGNWAEDHMIPYTTYLDLSQQPQVEQLILSEIKEINKQLPDVMKLKRFLLLYKLLDADDEELTRTGKVRRRFVYGLYIKLIEAMYSDMPEIAVTGKVRYRDGQIGEIETTVKILNVDIE